MKYTENNLKYISKPARKQKEFIDPKKYHIEGANEYNIWYDRTVGDIKDNSAQRDAAEDRCVIERDAGFTKADKGINTIYFDLPFHVLYLNIFLEKINTGILILFLQKNFYLCR